MLNILFVWWETVKYVVGNIIFIPEDESSKPASVAGAVIAGAVLSHSLSSSVR